MSDYNLHTGYYINHPNSILHITKTTKKFITYREFAYYAHKNSSEIITYRLKWPTTYPVKKKVFDDGNQTWITNTTTFTKFSLSHFTKFFKSPNFSIYEPIDENRITNK